MTTQGQRLHRDFHDRDDMVSYIEKTFPEAVAVDSSVSPIQGGRNTVEAALAQINPESYGKTRNYLDGSVTRLSPYVRHGVLSLAEFRDTVLDKSKSWHDARKLVQELAWRDYFQRVYDAIGEGIWDDREPHKTGWTREDYALDMPRDILTAMTGLECIDTFVSELYRTGYLHNHVRMYVAAYVVHFRRIRWQAGAFWFLQHLLDGDPASNNLSWQWVASTFSHKPYIFNRENLERFTKGMYCEACALYGKCEFEGSYDELSARLFPHLNSSESVTES